MIPLKSVKLTSVLFLAAAFFCAALISTESQAFWKKKKPEQKIEFQKKDQEKEQRKYLEKLKKDKIKVDLALRNTKLLIGKSKNKPYLPELYIRLAELNIEKSRIVYFIRKESSGTTDNSLNQLEANMLKNRALEIYQRILNHFPDYEQRDKVHFFMAHEYRELGNAEAMIKHYRMIISKFKKSAYVAESYLLLGDYFIHEQDLNLAIRHYTAVLAYPDSPAITIARYKLAWCHVNKAKYKEAIHLFEQSVTAINASKDIDIDTYKRVNIRLEALIDMAFCYPEVYKKSTSEDALNYFQKYAWSRQAYTTVLEKLAYRFLIKKKWDIASDLYRQLADIREDSEKLLEYASNIFECVKATGKFKDADKDVALIVKALEKQKYSVDISDEEKEKNLKNFELYARDIITHLHERAQKSKSMKEFKISADAYKVYLDFFEETEVRSEMEANYAEVLFSSEQYMEAGKYYEKIADNLIVKNKKKQEALYSAVISYYNSLKKKEELNYYQVAYTRDGLRTTGKLFAAEYPVSPKTQDVLFNVAWIAYDSGKHEDAIKEFSQFVKRYPKGKSSKAAVHLIMDSYLLQEDYDGLISYGKKTIGNPSITDRKLKQELSVIVKSAESRVVSSLTVAAIDDWDEGKEKLMKMADSGSSAMGEQALNALIVSSKEKKDIETLFSAGNSLITKYPKTDKIEDTLGVLTDTSLKISQYRMVADYLETFSEKLPKHENTSEFLHQAGNIRTSLGQYKKANQDFNTLLVRFPAKKEIKERIIFSMMENSLKMNDRNAALAVLNKHMKYLSSPGQVRANAWISNYYFENGNLSKATRYRKTAYGKYKSNKNVKDQDLINSVAEMSFRAVHLKNKDYMSLKLSKKIDNKIFNNKTKMLNKLEKGYQAIMEYQSPEWVFKACYYSAQINKEFSRFLKESPLPKGLSKSDKQKYTEILNQKASGYTKKADQYIDTCNLLAEKWELCDPDLAAYIKNPENTGRKQTNITSFTGSSPSKQISYDFIKDSELKVIHEKVFHENKRLENLYALSELYFAKGDYGHAGIIAGNALEKIKKDKDPLKSDFYNLLGLTYLNSGNDTMAKDSFNQALFSNSKNYAAAVNLAGILHHYGYSKKANNLYQKLPETALSNTNGIVVHPYAGELYRDYK